MRNLSPKLNDLYYQLADARESLTLILEEMETTCAGDDKPCCTCPYLNLCGLVNEIAAAVDSHQRRLVSFI